MKTQKQSTDVITPKNQLNLFGYKTYFDQFIKLYEKRVMPNSILVSGPKGLGKSTFVYHFVNYLLSKNEEKKYLTDNFTIDKDNISYKQLNSNTHPNFFLIENNEGEKDIKIDQVRSLLQFLSKSTYVRDLKIVMINNAENLNLNSSNALLKAIEEPSKNTFFFIIHNNSFKILDTIKSRCTQFKFFFTIQEKKNIFKNLIIPYKHEQTINEWIENLHFDTPGNLMKYFLILSDPNINLTQNKLSYILYFIEKYKKEKNTEILYFLTLFIELFYNDLCLKNNKNINSYFFNLTQILKQIDNMKKFNLSEKNTLVWIKDILINEAK